MVITSFRNIVNLIRYRHGLELHGGHRLLSLDESLAQPVAPVHEGAIIIENDGKVR